MTRRAARRLAALACLLPAAAGAAGAQATLAVHDGRAWRVWWRADRAPARWTAPAPTLAAAVRWRPGAPGVEWAELRLRGDGEAWRTRAVLVRLDPARLTFRLHAAGADGWAVEDAPAEAAFAVNAGQFDAVGGAARPWGWLVRDGEERQRPGVGPLATAVAFDSAGGVRTLRPAALATWDRVRGVAAAFQSYPTLLAGGDVPAPLRTPGLGVDHAHRDARLLLGRLADGRLLVALTRFDALGPTLGAAPFGLTTPEMAALAGALGCRDAVLLDGGISAQLLLRDAAGRARRWPGLRRVPLALVALPRGDTAGAAGRGSPGGAVPRPASARAGRTTRHAPNG